MAYVSYCGVPIPGIGDRLSILGVSDPSLISEEGIYQGKSQDCVGNFDIENGYLYWSDFIYPYYDNDFIIVDVSDPSNSSEIGHIETSGEVVDIVVEGNYGYLAVKNIVSIIDGLRIFDISDRTWPRRGRVFRTPGPPHSLAVVDNYAVHSSWRLNLR